MKFFLLTLLAVIFLACQPDETTVLEDASNIITLNEEVLIPQSAAAIGGVWDMEYCQDGYLLISELGNRDSLIRVYNTKTRKLEGFLFAMGSGPEAIDNVNDIACRGKELHFVDANNYDAYLLQGYDISGDSKPNTKELLSKNFAGRLISSATWASPDRIISVPLGPTDEGATSRFITMENGNFLSRGAMPQPKDEDYQLDSTISRAANEASVALHPKSQNFYLAYKYSPTIEAYSSDLTKAWTYKTPDHFFPEMEALKLSEDFIVPENIPDKTRYGFTSVASSDNYVYALYAGNIVDRSAASTSKDRTNAMMEVYQIDAATGALHAILQLPRKASRIAVASDDAYLYVVTYPGDTEEELVRYAL